MLYRIERLSKDPLRFAVFPKGKRSEVPEQLHRFQAAQRLTQKYFEAYGNEGPGRAMFIIDLESALNRAAGEDKASFVEIEI